MSEKMRDGFSHIGKKMQEKTEICLKIGCQIPMEFGSQFAPSPWVGVSTTTCRGGLVTEAAKVL